MSTTHVDFGENVFISHMFSIRVNIVHHPIDLKISYHFIHIIRNYQGVRFTGGLKNIASFFGNPFVLEIMPI